MKYQKKPVIVEAHQWWQNRDHPEDGDTGEGKLVRYFRHPDPRYAGIVTHEQCGFLWHVHGWIETLEGGHNVCPGDWIITGTHGERYPCKPAIFEVIYEPVE